VYLPADLMRAHGVTRDDLAAWRRGAERPHDGWRAVLEALIAEADAAYDDAKEAMPALPVSFRRATAVAARVYRGIHDEIRRADYDTLRRRVWVRPRRKLTLAAGALVELASAGRVSVAARP
jgi:phytoene synthase